MYLLDTDTCIEILRGRLPRVQAMMQSANPALFGVPAVVEAELLFGAANSDNPEEGRFYVESLLAPFTVFSFDSRCAAQYAAVRVDLKQRGCMIGPNNLLIAATALANSATLVSNNVREFHRVQGLLLESWSEIEFEDD